MRLNYSSKINHNIINFTGQPFCSQIGDSPYVFWKNQETDNNNQQNVECSGN